MCKGALGNHEKPSTVITRFADKVSTEIHLPLFLPEFFSHLLQFVISSYLMYFKSLL